MSYFDIIRAVTTRYNNKIKRSCSHLFDCFNLNHFWYCKIDENGHYSFIGSDIAWCEYFAEQKLYLTYPFLRHPSCLKAGVNLLNDTNDPGLKGILSSCDEFNLRFCMSVINKYDDGMEEIGFASSCASAMQVSMLINELPLLRHFVKHFKAENQFLFSKLVDNQVDMAELVGPAFYEKSQQISPCAIAKQAFMKKMGIHCGKSLTPREVDVIRLLIQGYSAGKIASAIYLSRRTVEHHIERIKEKLECDSRLELIQKSRELEQYGYLTY